MDLTDTTLDAVQSADHVARRDDDVLYQNQRTLIVRHPLRDGFTVVLKQAFGADAQTRLRHEASILARLTHIPGVVELLPELKVGALTFKDDGGVSLAQVLLKEKLSIDAIVTLALSLTQTLSAVHLAGVIHKDINPSNILLVGADRQPVLIDFNIASCFAEERLGFTHQSHIAGTLAYMSPEQTGRTGRAIDQRSDLYALGVMLYELTVGHKPFESEDMLEMIHDHLVRQPVSPAQLKPSVPLALSDIVMRLLEKEADRRYQTADGLRRDLVRLRQRIDEGLPERSFPLGQDDFPLRLTPPSSLVGRQAEIETLQETMDSASRGEGRALLVAGAPGVGKSALINELQPMVTARRGWFVTGKFEQYQRDSTSAFVQALRALGRLLLAEPEAALKRHRERILKALGPNAGLGPSRLPEFAVLLGQLPKIRIDDPVEAETRMLQATVDLLKSVVSPEQPLVIVVDDLQWAPAISLRLMDALMTNDQELQGLLLIGAYRGNEVDAAHPLSAMLSRWEKLGVSPPIMQLTNLPTGDISVLIGEMLRLPEREAKKLGSAIYERTGGNPYDTVELINALRQDGLLTPSNGTWQWDQAAIRQYVGDCDVVGLLGRRIDKLPTASHSLLALLACLGGEVDMRLLQVASAMNLDEIEAHLAPALEDGLIVAHNGHEREIRFRHDRVQQAMHERMATAQTHDTVQLALARRLARHIEFCALAAQQYLPTYAALTDPDECRHVIALFDAASVSNRVVNYDLCERFLSGALSLMKRIELRAEDKATQFRLLADRHAALYGLGRLDEADAVYEAMAANHPDPYSMVDTTAVQIASLGARSQHKPAVALGIALLKELGLAEPPELTMAIGMTIFKTVTWIGGPDKEQDLSRPEVSDARVLALSKILSKTQVAAFFCNTKLASWLAMASHELWVEHGPCQPLMATMCAIPMILIATGEDFKSAYTLAKHLITVGEQRKYEPATSVARFLFAYVTSHWLEPFEHSLGYYRKAREVLLQAGDMQYATFTYASWGVPFDVAPNIEHCLEEVHGGTALAIRTGDQNYQDMNRYSHQLVKSLMGQIADCQQPGCFDEAGVFNEAEEEKHLTKPTLRSAYYYMFRSLTAAIYNDEHALHKHTTAAALTYYRMPGNYLLSRAQTLHALSLAQQLRKLPAQEQAPLLAELDKCLKWLKRRAKDAPFNFQHLQYWIEAERAWSTGDMWAATSGFSAAMEDAAKRSRPWQRALIVERAARFHLAAGMAHMGEHLLQDALDLYDNWGAKPKVAQLKDEFPALRGRHARSAGASARSTIVSTDMVDVLSVLRASQALSSETSLARLNSRVGKVLIAMTGAASVQMVVRTGNEQTWQVLVPDGNQTQMVALDAAAQQNLLPLSAFQYAQRTREPLLLTEATKDDRFSRDPYFNGVKQSSMLILPVQSKGDLRAMLVLENRLSRGAFSSDRLDAVSLIAGQLSVSLDNALLYASLEQKVAERTAALEEANQRLELLSSTDALTGVSNRRKFNETLDAEWLRAKRTKQPIGLILIDIDHFKLYNDHYGHQGGDACLQMVAAIMRIGLRAGSDLLARYGGEEFVLLLPNTDLEGTYVVAERVRMAIADKQEPHLKSSFGFVSISVGITSFVPTHDTKPTQFIEQADQALYEAKRAGRNQVCWPKP